MFLCTRGEHDHPSLTRLMLTLLATPSIWLSVFCRRQFTGGSLSHLGTLPVYRRLCPKSYVVRTFAIQSCLATPSTSIYRRSLLQSSLLHSTTLRWAWLWCCAQLAGWKKIAESQDESDFGQLKKKEKNEVLEPHLVKRARFQHDYQLLLLRSGFRPRN